MSKYDIATGQVVRQPTHLENGSRSSSLDNKSLLALTNEATKAAMGQQIVVDEMQVAPWRMNVYNLDPNYTYQSSNQYKGQLSS